MTNLENKVQIKVIFLCLEPLPLNTNINLGNDKTKAILLSRINTNINLSNNKTKAILLSRIKRPIGRLLLLISYHLNMKDERT